MICDGGGDADSDGDWDGNCDDGADDCRDHHGHVCACDLPPLPPSCSLSQALLTVPCGCGT